MARRPRTILLAIPLLIPIAVTCVLAFQPSPSRSGHLIDSFAAGWMLIDTNDDGIADAIRGKIVVPAEPTAAENSSAGNFAARLAYGSTGLTLPLVVTAGNDSGDGPRIWIGKRAVPSGAQSEINTFSSRLEKEEGGVFAIGGDLAVIGADDAGLQSAAEAYSSRAPYQWKVPGDQLSAIAEEVGSTAELAGITYLRGKPGIHRAYLRSPGGITKNALASVFSTNHLAAVQEIIVLGGGPPVSALNPKPLSAEPAPAAALAPGAGGAAEAATQRLDLASLYTSKGLFRGTPKMPVPSSLDSHLYVPGGAAGTALANLAARMGLEATGITLPLATPADGATARGVRTQAVIAGTSALAKAVENKLRTEDTAAAQAETDLRPGEGEVRVVDDAFSKRAALLVRGDDRGAPAALGLLSGHFPNLWESGKQYLSVEEIRYDLHRFFSLRSGVAQAAMALHHLDSWMSEIAPASGVKDVKAEVYVDLADPGLNAFVRDQIQRRLGVANADIQTGSLRAGTQCCGKDVNLHYQAPGYQFRQAAPTFEEDVVIPWEGTRLLQAVEAVKPKVQRGDAVSLLARVSEGPQERAKLQQRIIETLTGAGADPRKLHVSVLSAYKQGYSWLMDEIAPELAGKPVASLKIEFAKNVDATRIRAMYSPARWVHELYPVDEMLARKLNIPLEKISLAEFESAGAPTYRVHAYNASGQSILDRDFTVTTVFQPYNAAVPQYEQVQVDTGWVNLSCGSKVVLDQRIKTDIEEFWEHYQTKTLPKIFQFVMAQSKGDLKQEFAPPFDTLTIDIHMSEPDYDLDLDKERISSLEALQEDTFYSTDNFINTIGNLKTGRPINYVGRIIPIVHRSEDGQDGRVHIEFYGKPAANPLVRLSWIDANGQRHEKERNLPVMGGDMQPRLIQARVKAEEPGVESLTWLLAADYLDDKYEDWLKLESLERVDRTIFAVERAKRQLHWLEQMHSAGLYKDEIAYPHLKQMAVEFELPPAETAQIDTPAERAYVTWSVAPPATPRPMIADYAGKIPGSPIVQWNEPIDPEENAAILARLATYPGVNVYWMGRSYLGQNLWAADLMLPSPSALRSWAKETTLKPVIVYSGRQHANEVSSTSHIDKLAEMLVTDAETRAMLKHVNVVLHPITNADGAQLSVDLAKITPDNLLHPGYHGSLSADVSMGQSETDPVYPESRTRKQLIDGWLPDAFLNPHGYPSHEWVQPFSEYTGWVQSRQGANPGRAWWIPRGWFTSLNYLRDPDHPYSKQVTFAIRDRIVEAERNVPGLLPLEERMNARYERFGQRWQPQDMFQPIVNGIRIYMALKGSPARGASGPAGEGARGGATGGVNPDITWDSAYTEAPDETAHGDYLKLMASAGLAFDLVHLKYLAEGEKRISRTERDSPTGVQRRVDRARPILPPGTKAPSQPATQN